MDKIRPELFPHINREIHEEPYISNGRFMQDNPEAQTVWWADRVWRILFAPVGIWAMGPRVADPFASFPLTKTYGWVTPLQFINAE